MVPLAGRSWHLHSVTCFTAWLDLQFTCKSTCESLLYPNFTALYGTLPLELICVPEPDLSVHT